MSTTYVVRSAGLITEALGDELVLYDGDAHVAHALSGPAAAVWTACTSARSVDQLVESTGLPADVVRLALAELDSAGLIDSQARLSRRGALAGAAALGLATPMVLSLPIATTAAAASIRPTGNGLYPASGPVVGGTAVTITGTSFVLGNTSVDIGGSVVPASQVIVNSTTSLSFDTPAESAGNVAVSVTTPAGTSGDVPGGFTYEDAPTATSLSPSSGPTTGDATVMVIGTNFVIGGTSVTIGTTVIPSSQVDVNSPTDLTFVTPAASVGNVSVTVSTAGGTSSPVPGGFTYSNI